MKRLKNTLRWLTPLGLIERHRRSFNLGRLGLPGTASMAEAVEACRYDLWPQELRQAQQPWLLVDVGANLGEFTAAAARLTRLKGVHAFEPQPSCHEALHKALKAIPNSHLHGVAVGAQQGEIELLCTANSKLASVLSPNAQVAAGYGSGDFVIENRLKVPLVRLDDVIPTGTEIGLLKIDVQGYELPVLEGAAQTLRHTQTLLMEVNYVPHYEGGAAFDELHEAVRRHGFRTFGISAPYGGGAQGPLWADAIFVRA
jgi:FkbM family methyltransferase